jgi:glycine/D-amino acid oxidase-like deaminating enzyme
MTTRAYEIAIIGGGINGAGIARGAAERGLRVLLAKQYDLGLATSSASLTVMRPKAIDAPDRWMTARQASAHPTPAAAE